MKILTKQPQLSIPASDIGQQRDQAYHRLRRLLILQQVSDGSRLREAEWAERLQVNRTALREAFARLEAEGLIEKGVKTGYFVPLLSPEDIHEIIEVRLMLEGGAIGRVCSLGNNTVKHLKRMREACEQLARLVREDYLLGVAEADRRFHEALIEAAGNRRLSMLYQRAPLPMIHPEIVSGPQWMARVEETHREHNAILDAMLEGNVVDAQQMLRKHLLERSRIPLSPL
jgi:DNA-binding GntR family transcriptional regulator